MSDVSRRTFLVGAAGILAASSGLVPSRARAKVMTPTFEIDQFVSDLRNARRETESQKAIEEVLARTVSDPSRVLQGIGEPRDAGIHTLYRADDLTILNVVWAPLMLLLPHNHKMWASIGIYTGREDNITWKRQGTAIEASGAASLSEKEVFSLPDTAIHSVTNPIERLTGAFHVYGGDFFAHGRSEWDAETLQERPFDLEAARHVFEKATKRFEAVR
jgi:predicted metal-dependent enzyme (double-stranded beta helix superfamily)